LDYKSGKCATYEEVAKKYKVTVSAVRQWQQRYWRKWDEPDDIQSDTQDIQNSGQGVDYIQDGIQQQGMSLDNAYTSRLLDTGQTVNQQVEQADSNLLQLPNRRQVTDADVSMVLADEMYQGLEQRHKDYIDEYLLNGHNGTNAYLKVYKCSLSTAQTNSSKLLANAKIAHVLGVKLAERAAEAHTDMEYLLVSAKETVARCMQAAPVMTFNKQTKQYEQVKDDNGANIWQFDSKGAIAGLELIAKLTGQLVNKSQVDVTTKAQQMSPNERKAEISKMLQQLGFIPAIDAVNRKP
jgi:hypothetical protein